MKTCHLHTAEATTKSSFIDQTTLRNRQAAQRLHAFQLVTLAIMCHRPHMAQLFQRACCLGTSSADAPRTESHRSDFAAPTNGTELEATPSLTNMLLVLGLSGMMQPSLLPPIFPAQPAMRRLDVDRT